MFLYDVVSVMFKNTVFLPPTQSSEHTDIVAYSCEKGVCFRSIWCEMCAAVTICVILKCALVYLTSHAMRYAICGNRWLQFRRKIVNNFKFNTDRFQIHYFLYFYGETASLGALFLGHRKCYYTENGSKKNKEYLLINLNNFV